MSKLIGVIVDGPGDYASLRARLLGKVRVVKTDGPRGHTVTARQLVSSARKQVLMLRALGCPFVILMLDFEERSISYENFVSELKAEVKRLALPTRVEICVPNRMIENWFLADVEILSAQKTYIKNGITQSNFEGTHGKKELKKVFEKGVTYNEIRHGAELFSIIRFDIATGNSSSFKCFLDLLSLM